MTRLLFAMILLAILLFFAVWLYAAAGAAGLTAL